jgi:hypothetical protein
MTPIQGQHHLTVLDYYKLLPEKYLEADHEQRIKWMLDPKRGAIVDINNGYIYAAGDGAQADIFVCVFRKADGTNLIAVKTFPGDTDEYTYLTFFIYKDSEWKNVTKTVLPLKINQVLKYEIPRYGKNIRVTSNRGKSLYDFVWTGEVFRLEKKNVRN